MSQYTRWAHETCALCLIFICSAGHCFADDVPLPLKDFLQRPEVLGYRQLEIFASNFCVTVIIEYLVICAFLGWPRKALIRTIPGVLLLNVITNPAAQAGAIFFGRVMGSESSAWAMVGLIELAVMAMEFGLLTWILNKMYRQGLLDELVTAKRIILMVAVANVASFAFGFAGLVLLLIERGL